LLHGPQSKGISLDTTRRPLGVTHELHACEEASDVLQSKPNRLHPGFSVAVSCQEAEVVCNEVRLMTQAFLSALGSHDIDTATSSRCHTQWIK